MVFRPTHWVTVLLGACLAAGLGSCSYDLDEIRGTERVADGPQSSGGGGAMGADAAPPMGGGQGDGSLPDAASVAASLPEVFPDRPPSTPIPKNAVGAADLVAYWPLDEGQGQFAWDVTGNGNDGALLLGTSWRSAGFPRAAFVNPSELQFDGIDDLAEFTLKTLPALDQPKSVSLWARYDYDVDPARAQALLVLLNRKTAGGVRIEFRAGRLIASTYFYTEIVGHPAPPLGWHHVVYTYDGNTHSLYVDGGPPAISMMAAETGDLVPPDGRCRVGRSSSTVDDPFRGFIDDVRIYKRALTAAEVNSLYLGAP